MQPTECCTYLKLLKSSGAFMVLPLFKALPEFLKALRLLLVLLSHCCGCGDLKGSALLKSVRQS